MKVVYRILFILHIFVGIGAIAGGMAAIINPNEPLGMSTVYLRESPFTNYLIPGIILFVIIGLGNVASALTLHFKWKFQGYTSSIVSWALVIWIVVQCLIFSSVQFLHVLYFIIGLIQAALSMALLFDKRLFPANIVLKVLNK